MDLRRRMVCLLDAICKPEAYDPRKGIIFSKLLPRKKNVLAG